MSSADTTGVLIVKHTPCKVVGWLGVAFFLFCGVAASRAGDGGASLLAFVLLLPGVYLGLSSGSMQVDSDSVRYHLPLRSYQIKWNEVQYMEIDITGSNMVLVGENKRLAMIGPYLWSNKNKRRMLGFMADQVDKYGIQIRVTQKAMFRFSKNTKADN